MRRDAKDWLVLAGKRLPVFAFNNILEQTFPAAQQVKRSQVKHPNGLVHLTICCSGKFSIYGRANQLY